jgi:lycopene beta-cyclase
LSQRSHIVFAGGGGAAHSLIAALDHVGILNQYQITIIEPDPKNNDDRTWCFWSDTTDAAYRLFAPLADHRWSQFHHPSGQIAALDPYEYLQIRSNALYRFVQAKWQDNDHIKWRRDSVENIYQHNDYCEISTEQGLKLKADYVFDSRVATGQIPSSELLWQSFVGWRIKTEKPIFDPKVFTFMDFEVPQMDSTQFMYVLPTSPKEALVEYTRFGRPILGEEESGPVLKEYISRLGSQHYEIVEKEIAKIPMTLALNEWRKNYPSQARVIPIGTAAGCVKASTGFAFKRIAEHSLLMAEALRDGAPLPRPQQRPRYWLYDELLMRILSEKPNLGKPIFETMFLKQDINTIFRFLDETASFAEDLKIMYKMPWSPFLWSLKETLSGNRSLKVKK